MKYSSMSWKLHEMGWYKCLFLSSIILLVNESLRHQSSVWLGIVYDKT